MQRFRGRGCLTLGALLGVATLLACGWLYLLLSRQDTPDVMAELKQLPLYPGASAVVFTDPEVDADSLAIASLASMSLEATDAPDRVIDFYVNEFNRRGWGCEHVPSGAGPGSRAANCSKMNEGMPQFLFTGFDAPDARPPWMEIYRPVSWRIADVIASKARTGPAATNLTLSYEYILVN